MGGGDKTVDEKSFRRGAATKHTITTKKTSGVNSNVQREVEARDHADSGAKKLEKQKAQARSKASLRTKRGFAQRPDAYDEVDAYGGDDAEAEGAAPAVTATEATKSEEAD
jgi:hypothetical protein